jgi:hypothetical protein
MEFGGLPWDLRVNEVSAVTKPVRLHQLVTAPSVKKALMEQMQFLAEKLVGCRTDRRVIRLVMPAAHNPPKCEARAG